MIYLRTGQPGHGKTLLTLTECLAMKKAGRVVYAEGVPGLSYEKTGFLPLPDPTKWEELPDNSVIFVDECYRHFPNRAANSSPPKHVEALARHRHRGFDFYLVCQLGNQVDPFLRGLVDQHTHVRRKFGFSLSVLKTWDHYEQNPLKQDGSNRTWRLPVKDAKREEWYHSTTQDTTKKRLPWYFVALPILLCYLGYVGWKITSGHFVSGEPDPKAAAVATTPGATGASATGAPGGVKDPELSKEEYLRLLTPRVPTKPYSAPAFDHRRVASEPQVFCMSFGHDGTEGCSCMTEQGTRYQMPVSECMYNARYGPDYNPFLKETAREKREGAGRVRDHEPERATPFSSGHLDPQGITLTADQVSGYGDFRSEGDGDSTTGG